ncbi:carbamate kinase [bacterium]|nr:carbamate kinase [bacterium]
MNKLAVVALGGNALIHEKQKGTIDDQEHNVYETSLHLVDLIKKDYHLVIGHGNGPQVGNIMLSNMAGLKLYDLPDMPLDIDVAYSQGFIGYMIEQQLENALVALDIQREIVSLITQVLVDKNDGAFRNPTKPIGPYYTREESEKITAESSAVFAEDPRGRGFRKVVASPKPIRINNCRTIERLAREGKIVIAAGGGGIPVFYVKPGKLQGIDAVIDKDLALSMLATEIRADEFFILTDVPKVCLHFNTPQEITLDKITISGCKKYLNEGHFSEGSMSPKIRAAMQFIENGGKEAVIMNAAHLGEKNAGTRIIPD